MSNSQPGEASGPVSGLEQPSLYEFLTRLVSSPDARAAFDADPRATLDQAGLEGMTSADVLQASSLVLDYAPIEVVEEYDRSLQSSVEKFAANTQFAAFNHLHSDQPHEQEVTDQNMLHSTPEPAPDFSDGGDVTFPEPAPMPTPAPSMPAPGNTDVDIDSEVNDSGNLISVHDVVSGNEVGNENVVGNAVGGVDSLVGTVGDTVTGTVGEVTGTVEHTVDTGTEFAAGAGSQVADTVEGTVDTGAGLAAGAGTELNDTLQTGIESGTDLTGNVTESLPLDLL